MDDEASQKKKKLDDVIWNLVYAEGRYRPDEAAFKEMLLEAAKKYLENPWMHTPWLTTRVLTKLLDAESALVGKVVSWPVAHPFQAIGLIAFFGFFLYLNDYDWFSWLFVAAWLVGLFWWWQSAVRKTRALQPIWDEVATGNYCGEEIARRLRHCEKKGLCVPTLAYALLRL